MRGIGLIELFVLLGVLVLMLGLAAVVGAVAWFIVKRRPPQPTASLRSCTSCGQQIPDAGSYCWFCGQKIA